MAGNHRVSALNRGLLSNRKWLRSENSEKFSLRMLDVFKKHILVKNIYKWTKHSFVTTSQIKKQNKTKNKKQQKNPNNKQTNHGMETRGIFFKEKIIGENASKEGHTDSLLGHERIHHY